MTLEQLLPTNFGQIKIYLDPTMYGIDYDDGPLTIDIPEEYKDRIVKQLETKYKMAECEDCETFSETVKPYTLAGSGHRHDPATEIVELCEKCKNKREREE